MLGTDVVVLEPTSFLFGLDHHLPSRFGRSVEHVALSTVNIRSRLIRAQGPVCTHSGPRTAWASPPRPSGSRLATSRRVLGIVPRRAAPCGSRGAVGAHLISGGRDSLSDVPARLLRSPLAEPRSALAKSFPRCLAPLAWPGELAGGRRRRAHSGPAVSAGCLRSAVRRPVRRAEPRRRTMAHDVRPTRSDRRSHG